MIGIKSTVFLAIVGLILARFGFIIKSFSSIEQFKNQFELNDDGCELAGIGVGMFGSEDMALGKYGILFITSGDLNQTFGFGPARANPGNIWMLNMKTDFKKLELVKTTIDSLPPISQKGFRFQPHG